MSFINCIRCILSGLKNGLHQGVKDALRELGCDTNYSKQAFSKRRRQIRPEAFKEILALTVREFYGKAPFHRWHGHRVLAIDGTKYNLPTSQELLEMYGSQQGSNNQIQAMGSCLYDVLNGMILDAQLAPYYANERALAENHLQILSETMKQESTQELILIDRGYPSAKLIETMEKHGFHYVMRCSKEICRSMHLRGTDCTIMHHFLKSTKELKLRVLKIVLEDSEEILITNLYDAHLTYEDFLSLYHLRWGIEENYKRQKVIMEIENFSGTGAIAVQQDFYATLIISNIAAAFVFDNEDAIRKYNEEHEHKYEYKQNLTATIGELRGNLLDLIGTRSAFSRRKHYKALIAGLQSVLVPIRLGRTNERKRLHLSQRFPQNLRKS